MKQHHLLVTFDADDVSPVLLEDAIFQSLGIDRKTVSIQRVPNSNAYLIDRIGVVKNGS